MLGTRTAHLIILCIRVIKNIVDVLECQQFSFYGIAPVSPLYYHCGAAKNDAKFCITAALYAFRFPRSISSIWLVTAIHSLWLRMVAVNPSTVWNLKEKKCISKSAFSLKYFQPRNLIGDTVSPYYTDYISNDQTIKTICPVPFNLNMLFCGIKKIGQ